MRTPWRQILFYLGLSLLAGLIMISHDSLWIDEGQTLRFAQQPNLSAWVHELRHNIKSEAQMPLAMLLTWIGGHVVGLSEWQLRAPNLLWVSLAGVALGLMGRALKLPGALALFLLHPFLWFYANEARPYALEICAGAWLLYVLVRIHLNSTLSLSDTWIFGLAACGGFGASLLFAFPLLAVFLVVALFWIRGKLRSGWTPRHAVALLACFTALFALGLYYLFTLTRGASGARLWSVTPVNLVFALYEALGFSGLGPPRNELRELARSPALLLQHLLQPRLLAGLGTLALLYLILAVRLWKMRRDALVQWLLLALVATGGSLYVAAAAAKFPFWGRHLAPTLAFVVLLLALLAAGRASAIASWRQRALTILLAITWAASSLTLRFSPQHRKDDYRGASRLALAALTEGKVVWWSADDEECAAYYGLKRDLTTPAGGRLIFCARATAEEFARWPAPEIIIESKPDVFDQNRCVRGFLEKFQYNQVRRLSAFSIWAKPGTSLERIAP